MTGAVLLLLLCIAWVWMAGCDAPRILRDVQDGIRLYNHEGDGPEVRR